jgi:hypothetical protein
MSLNLQDVTKLAEDIAALRDQLGAKKASDEKALAVLAGIEAALADTAEAVGKAAEKEPDQRAMQALVQAIKDLKFEATSVDLRPTFNVPESPAPKIEFNPSINVQPAPERETPAWKSIKVQPKRDVRTGEVLEYIITRLS